MQRKILFGYMTLMAVIGSMTATLLHERNCVIEVKADTRPIHQIQHDINTAQRHISVIIREWEKPESFNKDSIINIRHETPYEDG